MKNLAMNAKARRLSALTTSSPAPDRARAVDVAAKRLMYDLTDRAVVEVDMQTGKVGEALKSEAPATMAVQTVYVGNENRNKQVSAKLKDPCADGGGCFVCHGDEGAAKNRTRTLIAHLREARHQAHDAAVKAKIARMVPLNAKLVGIVACLEDDIAMLEREVGK